MLKIRRFSIFVAAGLAIAMLVAGLPLSRFGLTVVSADYGPSAEGACAGSASYQVLVPTGTKFYSDVALTVYVGTITNPGPQKFLTCDASLIKGAKSFSIFLGSSNVVYVSTANLLIAPRSAHD